MLVFCFAAQYYYLISLLLKQKYLHFVPTMTACQLMPKKKKERERKRKSKKTRKKERKKERQKKERKEEKERKKETKKSLLTSTCPFIH